MRRVDDLSKLFTGSVVQKCDKIDVSTREECVDDEVGDSTRDPSPQVSGPESAPHTPSQIKTPDQSSLPSPCPTPISAAFPQEESSSSNSTSSSRVDSIAGCREARYRTEQLGVDRRLLVNRKRQLKMYRVWVQGKFRKL